MKKKIEKIKEKMRPRWAFVVFGLAVIVGGYGWFEWMGGRASVSGEIRSAGAEVVSLDVRRRIDGVLIGRGEPERIPVAVVVENSIDARPLFGIAAANLVWEAPVEAGITRLLAIYADGVEVARIGPVRSARPYFVDWAEEFDALFAHVGGSPEALAIIPSRDIYDLNQFWNDQFFWRSNDRLAPHNVYTSSALLRDALEANGVKPVSDFEPWDYQVKETFERGDEQECTVSFSSDSYSVIWKYDRGTNSYERSQSGELALDADGTAVRAKNVVILETDIEIIDGEGRRRIRTIGSGRATILRDGWMFTNGSWTKKNRADRTRFSMENGSEAVFNAGTTWIEVVRELGKQFECSTLPLPQAPNQ